MTQWSGHYEKQGGKRKCSLQNILHSRTKSDRNSLLVSTGRTSVHSQRVFFCTIKYWCSALVGCVSLFLCSSQQTKTWWTWRIHAWVCESLKRNRSSTSFPSYCDTCSQTKAVKREFKGERKLEKAGGRERYLGMKTEFRIWELGQGLCNKEGEENIIPWEREEKLNL